MLELAAARRGLTLCVMTAGTHAAEGVPPGARTLAALGTVAVLEPELERAAAGARAHRSRQLDADALGRADLVVAMEAAHVRHVRRRYPAAAGRTGMLRTLVRDLAPPAQLAPFGSPSPFAERIAALRLADAPLDPADDVEDPAGHAALDAPADPDDPDAPYAACAAELWSLCAALVRSL
jgi:protein-tyrosine-phosphatase